MELTKEQIEERKSYIGKTMVGFRFESTDNVKYTSLKNRFIGKKGVIKIYYETIDVYGVQFGGKDSVTWAYPAEEAIKQKKFLTWGQDNAYPQAMRAYADNPDKHIVKENESLTLTKDICTDILMKLHKYDLEILVDKTSTSINKFQGSNIKDLRDFINKLPISKIETLILNRIE